MTYILPPIFLPRVNKISLGLFPGDESIPVELFRSTNDSYGSTTPGTFARHLTFQPGSLIGGEYIYKEAVSGGQVYFYKARHVGPLQDSPAYAEGVFTQTIAIRGRPTITVGLSTGTSSTGSSTGVHEDDDYGGGGDDDDVLESVSFEASIVSGLDGGFGRIRASRIAVGHTGSTDVESAIEKVLVIYPSEYKTNSSTDSWAHDGGGKFVRPASTQRTRFTAPVLLPAGVKVTLMRGQFYRQAAADTIDFDFQDSSGSTVAEASLHRFNMQTTTFTSEFGGWYEVESSALSIIIEADHIYTMHGNCLGDAVSGADTRIGRIKLTYEMTEYGFGY